MIEPVNETIGVITVFNHIKHSIMPVRLYWRGRTYTVTKMGYHHKAKVGRTTIHIFSVCNDALAFKLQFNSENLEWRLEEVSDGLTT